jgi:hypothetical protein
MLKAIPTPNGAKPSEMGPMRANSRPSGPLSKLEPSSPSAETAPEDCGLNAALMETNSIRRVRAQSAPSCRRCASPL